MIDYNEHINDTIHILNIAKVNLMDLSRDERTETLKLEQKMNETVNSDDTENFFKILGQWKNILINGTRFNTSKFFSDFADQAF